MARAEGGDYVARPKFDAPEDASRTPRLAADRVSLKWVFPSLTGAAVCGVDGNAWYRIGGADAEAGFAARPNPNTKRRRENRAGKDESGVRAVSSRAAWTRTCARPPTLLSSARGGEPTSAAIAS